MSPSVYILPSYFVSNNYFNSGKTERQKEVVRDTEIEEEEHLIIFWGKETFAAAVVSCSNFTLGIIYV